MIAKIFVFACAAFGLVAGSCFEWQTEKPCVSKLFNAPVSFQQSLPIVSTNVLSGSVPVSKFDSCNSNVLVGFPFLSNAQPQLAVNLGNSGSNLLSNSGLNVVVGSSAPAYFDGNSNGPESAPLPLVQAPPVTLPTVESPMVTLSAPAIPAPKVLASRCVCTKTVVKPQVYQRVVTVPKVQRYLKRTVTPVVENLVYKSKPLSSGNGVGAMGSVVLSRSGSSNVLLSGNPSQVLVSGTSSPVFVAGSSHGKFC